MGVSKNKTRKRTDAPSKARPRRKSPPPAIADPAPVLLPAAKLDRDLARAALQKQNAGKTPSAAELAALKRFLAANEERDRWLHYASIPQKHWLVMSGRPAKVINEQADRYKIPFNGATIDLPKVVRAWHDYLAAQVRKPSPPATPSDGDPFLNNGDSPALERYRAARAKISELELAEKQLLLLSAADVESGRIARIEAVRRALESLPRVAERLVGMSQGDIETVLEAEAIKILHGFSRAQVADDPPREQRPD